MERPGRPGGIGALRARVLREALVVAVLTALSAVASVRWDLPELLGGPADDVVLVLAFSHLLMMVFGKRRSDELKAEVLSRRAAEEELRHRAQHDALTGLLNRAALVEEIERAVTEALAGGPAAAVVLMDLDRFKEVNDTLGHDVGDILLRAVALRLADELRGDTVLARLGGDEFVLLLRGCDADEAAQVAERALRAVRRPFPLAGVTLEVDGSCGVAVDGPGAADLLRHADVAMYAAKADHLGVAVYRTALDADAPAQLSLFGELRRAIREGELLVHYQPRVAVADGRVLGVEALVRWRHPERGLVPPSEFVPLAEQTGLIHPLTEAVLDQALAACRRWRDQGLALTVGVNLSARSLLDAGLADQVAALLARHGLPPACLELEITESAAMKDPERALEVLHRLRDLGLELAVDDYGTGHASLAYLTRLPVSTLKIDRSFVQTMELDTSDRTIVRSTVDLAHSLGLRVVAEGVETRATWDELGRLGCDAAQGYWLARPLPGEELPACVAELEARLTARRVG
ncbi:putative bifunctional diguanylate cyclase/phosphodiesterase [Blastococcus xanthinilyticus]|uniref:Diguanylate cyclase (GGDEF)-like protein n=1 Tax=Blastococcus xanthinilyticus TaxID=1564164 RepID=A0A5S5CSF2_9ACTN|nr:bifunctional diguanylate cyclase/phosphodiesterase [Blastococcus xanthinilyticus]TYP86767.1 diguanylate cyclase (GGDEF)-like protein [Blastococcus xanthinilyticus]